jgi:fibronectin-binding autotransporter adhesin
MKRIIFAGFITFLTTVFCNVGAFAQTNQCDVSLTNATLSGTWSGGTTGPYTFTPNASTSAATVSVTEIIDRLVDGGTNAANDVTIVTTSTGGNGSGNITVSSAITAANTASAFTFTLTAGGTLAINANINLTPANSGGVNGTGRNGHNMVFTSVGAITSTGALTATGNIRGNAIGGSGGDITLTSTGANIAVGAVIVSSGAAGSGGTAAGGDGGTITLTAATGIRITLGITANGGAAAGAGVDGAGGNLVISNGSTTVTTGGGINDGQTAGIISLAPGTGGTTLGTFTKLGAGTLMLAGTNTFGGACTITGGTVRVNTTNIVASTSGPLGNSALPVTLNGGAIEVNVATFSRAISVTANNSRIDAYGSARSVGAAISATGSFNLAVGGTNALNAEGQNLTLTGVISNGTGTLSLTKTLTSTVILSTSTNTYTGGTTINAGTLSVNSDARLGGTSGAVAFNGGTLAVTTGFTLNSNRAVSIGSSGGTIDVTSGQTLTYTGAVTGGNNLTKTSAGGLTFGAGNVTVNNLTVSAGTFTSSSGTLAVSGNFNTSAGTFTHNSGTVNFNGTAAQTFTPAASASFNILTINNSHASGVTLAAAITVTSLTIGNNTSSLFSDGGNQVTSAGTLNLTAGTFKLGATATTTFPGFATRNILSGTTIEYAANATQTVSITPAYQHLTFSGSGTKNLASGTLSVAGNWAVGSAATLVNAQAYNITGNITGTGAITSGTTSAINITGNWTNTGDFVPSTSTVNFNGSSSQAFTPATSETFNTVKINNSTGVNLGAAITVSILTIGDVTSSSIFNDNGSQLSSSGTLNLTSGTFKLGSAGAATTFPSFGTRNISSGTTVEYASDQPQTVSATPSYQHLTFSGSNTKTVSSGTLSVAGNWAVGSTTALNTNNPTVSITGNITGSGNITSTSGTLSITGSWSNNGTFTHNSGTVNYNNASGSQAIAALVYRNLTLSNTSGTNTAAGAITVGLNFTMANSGATLDMGSNDLSIGGGVSMSGTIKTQSVSSTASNSSTPLPSGLSWGGTIEYNRAAGSQTIVAGTYTNLKCSNSSGIDSAGGAITVNGLLTVANGGTLNMLTSALGGTLTTAGTGTIKTQNSTSTPLPASIAWAPAIEYSRSGTQTVVAGTYSSLTTSGSSTKTMSGSVTVTSALTLTAGTLAVSSQVLTLQTNNLTRATGSLSVAGTIVFDYNGTITLPSSIITGVNNMTVSSGAVVNLPATTVTIAGTLNMTSGKLTMASGATLVLGGAVSNMSASNCIVGNTGTNTVLEIGGGTGSAHMGTIYMDQSTPGTSNTVPTLSFTRSALTDTVAFGNAFRVKTVLTPTRGTVISNGNVVIGSDINGTAKIYPDINAANFLFVGNVKVERYSKSKVQRRYILISSPVDAISVRSAWQDDIFITGTGTGGVPCGAGTGNGGGTDKYNSNGFDATTANLVSAYRYAETSGGWVALANTSYQLEKEKVTGCFTGEKEERTMPIAQLILLHLYHLLPPQLH